MGKGKMVLVSGIISICFVTIAIVVILFMSEESLLKKLLDEPVENVNATTEQPSGDLNKEEIHTEDSYQGIRTITDELGVHDILFESGTVAHTATSGPIQLTITDVRLEQLTPANDKVKNAIAGRNPSTVAILKILIENNGADTVVFNIDDAKIIADSNETTVFNPKLSTIIGSNFEANETKEGTLFIDFQSKPRDIASLQLKILPTYDKSYDEIGDPINLKVPMY